jgi:hypothetical protein
MTGCSRIREARRPGVRGYECQVSLFRDDLYVEPEMRNVRFLRRHTKNSME